MATGSRSGKANFEVTYDVTGAVNQQLQADVKKLQRSLLDLDAAYKSIARGTDIDKYWGTQLSSIDAVVDALQRFDDVKDTWRAGNNASDFLKSYNSFIAMGGSKDDVISAFGGEIDNLITRATQLAPVIAEAFDVSRLRTFYSAFEEMKSLGVDLSDVFGALRAGSPEEMNKALAEMNSKLQEAQTEADTLRGQMQTFANAGVGSIDELTEKLERLSQLQENVKFQFDEFLRRSGLGDLVDTRDVQKYYDNLSSGYYTSVEEAMAAIRSEKKTLFAQTGHEDIVIDNGQLEAFVTKLTEVSAAITEVKTELASLKEAMANTGVDGTGGVVARGVAAELSQSEELSEATRARMAEIAASSVDFKSIIEVLTEMIRTSFEAQGAMGTIGEGITRMLEGLASLGNIDGEKLQAIAIGLGSIKQMGAGDFSLKGIEKLAPALSSLERISNTAVLQALSGVNLSGFNNLSVKRPSLNNLATYLPTISSVNVDVLERLSAINFDNLNNLSVSKASVKNLADLAGIADTVTELQQRIDAAGIPQVKEENISAGAASAEQIANLRAEEGAVRDLTDAYREKNSEAAGGGPGGGTGGGPGGGGGDGDEIRARAIFLKQVADELRGIETTLAKNPTSYAQNYEEISGSIKALEGALEAGKGELAEWGAEARNADEATEEMLVKIRALKAELARNAAGQQTTDKQMDAAFKEQAALEAQQEAEALRQRNIEQAFEADEALRQKELASRQQVFEKEIELEVEKNAKLRALEEERSHIEAQGQINAESQKRWDAEQYYASRQAAAEKAAAAEEELWRKELAQMDEVIAKREAQADPEKISAINQSAEVTKLLTQYEQLQLKHQSVYEAHKADIDAYIAKMQSAGRITEEEYAQMKAAMTEYQREINTGAEAQEQAAAREANAQKRVNTLRNQVSKYMENNTRAYALFKTQLDSMFAELSQEGGVEPSRLAEIRMEFDNIKAAADMAGVSGQTFFQKLQSGWQKFGGWALVTKSFTKVIHTFKQMVEAVKEIDVAMTELRKVTDLTTAGYDRFYEQAAASAKTVGATVSDTINATADFARLGFDVSDALPLAEAALVYKNVGDGINDVSQATESLISTIKAFGYEADDAMSIVDRFNEVGNNFAISSTGIGDALARSASALAGANNTLDESIGLITAANAIVQNPDSVGTAMKTLTMYLRAAKTELEDAGESSEGCAESVSKLRS